MTTSTCSPVTKESVAGGHAPGFVEITIASTPKCLPIIRAAVGCFAEEEGFGPNDVHALVWAIDEALTNVIRHGYENRTDQPIGIGFEPVKSPEGRPGVRITVRDQ